MSIARIPLDITNAMITYLGPEEMIQINSVSKHSEIINSFVKWNISEILEISKKFPDLFKRTNLEIPTVKKEFLTLCSGCIHFKSIRSVSDLLDRIQNYKKTPMWTMLVTYLCSRTFPPYEFIKGRDDDKEFMQIYLKYHAIFFPFASDRLRNDIEIARIAASNDGGEGYRSIGNSLKNNEEIATLALKTLRYSYDRSYLLKKKDVCCMYHIPSELKTKLLPLVEIIKKEESISQQACMLLQSDEPSPRYLEALAKITAEIQDPKVLNNELRLLVSRAGDKLRQRFESFHALHMASLLSKLVSGQIKKEVKKRKEWYCVEKVSLQKKNITLLQKTNFSLYAIAVSILNQSKRWYAFTIRVFSEVFRSFNLYR